MLALFPARAAMVHQKEMLFGFMTPREYLIFNARARMSSKYTREQMLRRVEEVGRYVGEGPMDTCLPIYLPRCKARGVDPSFLFSLALTPLALVLFDFTPRCWRR